MPWSGERIRTSGLYVPNVALYQAKLHPAFLEQDLSRSAKAGDFSANLDAALGSAQQKLAGQITHGLGVGIAWQALPSGNGPQGFGVGRFTRVHPGHRCCARCARWPGVARCCRFQWHCAPRRHRCALARCMAMIRGRVFSAFAQIVAQVFAHLLRIAVVVEHVVDDLKGRAQCLPVGGAGRLDLWAGTWPTGPRFGHWLQTAWRFWSE